MKRTFLLSVATCMVICGCADKIKPNANPGDVESIWTSDVDILTMLKDSEWQPPADFLTIAGARNLPVRELAKQNVGEVISRVSKSLRDAGSTWRVVVVIESRDVEGADEVKRAPFGALLKNKEFKTQEFISASEVLWILRNELAFGVRYKQKVVYLGQRFN